MVLVRDGGYIEPSEPLCADPVTVVWRRPHGTVFDHDHLPPDCIDC